MRHESHKFGPRDMAHTEATEGTEDFPVGHPPAVRYGATGRPHRQSGGMQNLGNRGSVGFVGLGWTLKYLKCEPHWQAQMNPDEIQIILSWPAAGMGVPLAWGWQNEAKTKPKSEVAGAVNGPGWCENCPVSQGKADFWTGLGPTVAGGVKLPNEATELERDMGHLARQGGETLPGKGEEEEDWGMRKPRRIRPNPGKSK